MTGPSGGPLPAAPPPTQWGPESADAYVEANLDRFTPEALVASLVASGFDRPAAEAAIRRVDDRRLAAPIKNRARRVVVLAYGLVYLILVIPLVAGPYFRAGGQGSASLSAVILTVVLGIALAGSMWWVGRRRAPLGIATLVWLPLGLLFLIGGVCSYATQAPVTFLEQLLGLGPT